MGEQVSISLPISERLTQAYPELSLSSQAKAFLSEFENGQTDGVSCWRSDTIERRSGSKIEGVGLFASKNIDPKEIIAIKPGHVVGNRDIKENAHVICGSHQQIDRNRFLTGLTPEEVDKNLVGYNHSCDPNAKVVVVEGFPLAFIVTKKAIKMGEEITTDYSVSQSSNTQRIFTCNCASINCRGIILPGYDWLDPDFQRSHFGEFPYFIQEQIEEMNNMSEPRLNAKKRFLYTLQLADIITLLADEIEIRKKGMDQIVQDFHGDRKLARAVLRRLSGKDNKEYRGLLLKAAQLFAQACTLANIDDIGIDRNNPETVKEHLPELIELARHIDFYFN